MEMTASDWIELINSFEQDFWDFKQITATEHTLHIWECSSDMHICLHDNGVHDDRINISDDDERYIKLKNIHTTYKKTSPLIGSYKGKEIQVYNSNGSVTIDIKLANITSRKTSPMIPSDKAPELRMALRDLLDWMSTVARFSGIHTDKISIRKTDIISEMADIKIERLSSEYSDMIQRNLQDIPMYKRLHVLSELFLDELKIREHYFNCEDYYAYINIFLRSCIKHNEHLFLEDAEFYIHTYIDDCENYKQYCYKVSYKQQYSFAITAIDHGEKSIVGLMLRDDYRVVVPYTPRFERCRTGINTIQDMKNGFVTITEAHMIAVNKLIQHHKTLKKK